MVFDNGRISLLSLIKKGKDYGVNTSKDLGKVGWISAFKIWEHCSWMRVHLRPRGNQQEGAYLRFCCCFPKPIRRCRGMNRHKRRGSYRQFGIQQPWRRQGRSRKGYCKVLRLKDLGHIDGKLTFWSSCFWLMSSFRCSLNEWYLSTIILLPLYTPSCRQLLFN